MDDFVKTMSQFTFWISLSLRPKTETKRLQFGLRPEINQLPPTSSATHRWFRRISLFIFELSKTWSDFRRSKLNL